MSESGDQRNRFGQVGWAVHSKTEGKRDERAGKRGKAVE